MLGLPTEAIMFAKAKGVRTGMTTQGTEGIVKHNSRYALTAAEDKMSVPRSPRIALLHPKWKSSMEEEFSVLQRNQT